MVERFWRWLRRKLNTDLTRAILQEDVAELSTAVASAHTAFGRKFDDFHLRLAEAHQQQKQLAAALLAHTETVAKYLETLHAKIPFSWREYRAVDFAVSKIEGDKQFDSATGYDEQFREAIVWARRYCWERQWDVPHPERLRTMIESRMTIREPMARPAEAKYGAV